MRPAATFRAALTLPLFVIGACGDDLPTRSEWISHVRAESDNGITRELAGCVYDSLAKQPDLLRRTMESSELSKKDTAAMQKLYATCIVNADTKKADG